MKIRLLVIALLMLPLALQAQDGSASPSGRDQSLSRLLEGNARYVVTATGTGAESHPVACIVTCSDARVAPEILFDQTVGSLYVVRNLGCVPTADVLASVEYAVSTLHVPVVFVLGHTDCEAPAGTRRHDTPSGTVLTASHSPAPATEHAERSDEANARMTAMSLLDGSPAIAEAVAAHKTAIISGLIDVATGKVSFNTELAAVSLPAVHVAAAAPAQPAAEAAPAVSVAKAEVAPVKPAEPTAVEPAAKETHRRPVNSASFTRRNR